MSGLDLCLKECCVRKSSFHTRGRLCYPQLEAGNARYANNIVLREFEEDGPNTWTICNLEIMNLTEDAESLVGLPNVIDFGRVTHGNVTVA